jgi:AraC-like DNA-binding protein
MDTIHGHNGFSFFQPHKELQKYIAYYSLYNGKFLNKSPVFMPDLGGSIIISKCGDNVINLWGPYNKLTKINTVLNNMVSQFFIEFHPGGISFIVYPNCNEILNKQILLEDINRILVLKLKNIFEQYNKIEQIVSALNTLFLDILNNTNKNIGREILYTLQNSEITTTMYDFTEKIGYTTRHINRYLNPILGVSGKKYLKIKRFCQSVGMLKKTMTIEEIAFKLGYFDPPHFIHEFITVAGFPPSNFRKNMSDFYNDTMKKW